MSKVEIFAGGSIENAFKENGVDAAMTYKFCGNGCREDFTVWEIEETDMKRLAAIDDGGWPDHWGWWWHASGSNMGAPNAEYVINRHTLLAWDDDRTNWCSGCTATDCEGTDEDLDECYSRREFPDLLTYFSGEIGATRPRNVAALAMDMAKYNNMSMAELFKLTLPQ